MLGLLLGGAGEGSAAKLVGSGIHLRYQTAMVICVAGPYSALTEEERVSNLAAMNRAAVALKRLGHEPIIVVNAALPVLEAAGLPYTHPWMMEISLAVAGRSDGGLRTGRSPGADREMDLLAALGRPVFESIDAVPRIL